MGMCLCGGMRSFAYPINICSTPEFAILSTPTLLELHSRGDSNKQETLLTSDTEEKKVSSGLGLAAVESYFD